MFCLPKRLLDQLLVVPEIFVADDDAFRGAGRTRGVLDKSSCFEIRCSFCKLVGPTTFEIVRSAPRQMLELRRVLEVCFYARKDCLRRESHRGLRVSDDGLKSNQLPI